MRGPAKREHSERPALEEPGVPTPSATGSSALAHFDLLHGVRTIWGCESGRETFTLPRVTWQVANFSWAAFVECFMVPGGLRAG